MASIIPEHVEITPGVCGGKPRIAGHRIRVQDVVFWHDRIGMTPDEIVSDHPGITLADVHAAMAYYHDHREEIHEHMRESEERVAELKQQFPSKLQEKLRRLGS